MFKELDGKTPEQALEYLGRKLSLDEEDKSFIRAQRHRLSPERYKALIGEDMPKDGEIAESEDVGTEEAEVESASQKRRKKVQKGESIIN